MNVGNPKYPYDSIPSSRGFLYDVCQPYADDAVIYTAARVEQLIQNQLLNLKKTVSMCFSIKKSNQQQFKVNIHHQEISTLTQFKYLGIMLDPQFRFNHHINKA